MSISNYSGSADTFTFPVNPKTFDDEIKSNMSMTPIDFQSHHIVVGSGGISPKIIVLVGNFFGSSKNTNYQDLSKHFSESQKLKKLFWETDKFYLGIGETVKKTHSGGRTNFIDYVAQFKTVLGILLGATEKTSGTNAGNLRTFVTEISGTVTSGASAVTVTDNHNNQLTIPSSAISTGNAIVIKLVEMVDSGDGVFVSEYNYTTINGTQTRRIQVTEGLGVLRLDPGENISTVSTTNLSSVTKKFRDGWSS